MFAREGISKSLALLAIAALPLAVSAQVINLGNTINNAIRQAGSNQQPSGASTFNLPTATTNVGDKIWRGSVEPLYKTKADFIAAAQRGEFLGLAHMMINTPMGDEAVMQNRLIASIAVILADDYQTGVPAGTWCETVMAQASMSLLAQVTGLYTGTLTDTPPDFTLRDGDQVARAREEANRKMNHIATSCTRKVLGADQPYPMVEKLKDLVGAYAVVTKDLVAAKRAEKVQAYQAAQQRQQEAQQKAAADKAKAEQQRIDAERKRIEKEQQDQKARDDARVSG